MQDILKQISKKYSTFRVKKVQYQNLPHMTRADEKRKEFTF